MNIYNLYKIGCKNPVYNNLNNVKMEQIFVSEIKGKFLYFHIVNYYKGSCLRVGIIGSDILLFNTTPSNQSSFLALSKISSILSFG